MKIKESLVYDKHNMEVIGFVDLGDLNDKLIQLEQSCTTHDNEHAIATHLLTIVVRGIFSISRFPYAYFATEDITGEQLFPVVWDGIERLERLGFKVIALTADGASPNRKLILSTCILPPVQARSATKLQIHIQAKIGSFISFVMFRI